MSRVNVDWSAPEIVELLHNFNDCEVADKLGVTRQRVHQIRKINNIPSSVQRRRAALDKFEVSPAAFTKSESKLDEYKELLGTISDNEIARRSGVSQAWVSTFRRKLGIKPFRERKTVDVNWDELPLGKVSDSTIAEQLNCSVHNVYYARKARKIPSFRSTSKTVETVSENC